jgi:hypothetical protein
MWLRLDTKNLKSESVSKMRKAPRGGILKMSFETALDRLAVAVKRSRSKELKEAFVAYQDSFNESMRNYQLFLKSMIATKEFVEKWDVTLVQPKDD